MRIIIRADEGKWLTDGENYGKTMVLAKGKGVESYYEVTDEEYQQKVKTELESLAPADHVISGENKDHEVM